MATPLATCSTHTVPVCKESVSLTHFSQLVSFTKTCSTKFQHMPPATAARCYLHPLADTRASVAPGAGCLAALLLQQVDNFYLHTYCAAATTTAATSTTAATRSWLTANSQLLLSSQSVN